MEPSDIKEPLNEEELNNLVKEYYEIDKRINDMEKYRERFVRDINISNAHYRMVQTQLFAMLAYEQALRMRIEDYGVEV